MNSIITLKEAQKIISLVEEYARYKECIVSVAITNSNGNPICAQSMDDALIVSFDMAIKKAYTAAALQMPTHELAKLTEPGAPFAGLENMLEKQIVTIGGGMPLISNNKVIGAVGVSGGAADDDIDLATYAQHVWEGV